MQSTTDLPISTAPSVLGIGIDFGMTYSGAAIARFARGVDLPSITIVPGEKELSKRKIASKVFVNGHDRTAVAGNRAITKFIMDDTGRGRLRELFKRELVQDEDSAAAQTLGWTPQALTAEMIAQVLRDVEALLVKNGWTNARRRYAFGFPASWTPRQQFRLRQAAEDAGVPGTNLQLIDESLATALAAAHLLSEHRRALQLGRTHVFVCDIGGGTLDLAVVEVNPTGLVQVIGPTFGAARLGMSNLDKLFGLLLYEPYDRSMHEIRQVDSVLDNHIVSGPQLNEAWRSLGLSSSEQAGLLDLAEMLKIRVCNTWEQHSSFPATGFNKTNMTIPRPVLEPLFAAMREEIQTNIQLYFKQLADEGFGVAADDIRYVIVSGGGSALPGIHLTLRDVFPYAVIPAIPVGDASAMVQRGTAWFALQPDVVQLRRYGVSFGVAALIPLQPDTPRDREVVTLRDGGLYEKSYCRFIHRGDVLSSETTELEFRVGRDNQDAVRICVYEGEHDLLAKNTLIREVKVPLPDGARRDDSYLIVIRLQDDGMLHVRVKEARNGTWMPGEMALQWEEVDGS